MHHHVQAVTVLEATHPDNNPIFKTNGSTIKRSVYKDSNNNVSSQPQVTKESLNVASTSKTVKSEEEAGEYSLLGIVKFKSPIKWLNSISIILIHLIFLYGFVTYPLYAKIRTTLWGKLHITKITYSFKETCFKKA
jgi:hypothetical protein